MAVYRWRQLVPDTSPSARFGHSITADANRLILFGGKEDSTYLDDTWEYPLLTADWNDISPVTSPDPRANGGQQLVWNAAQAILFGGDSGGGPGAEFDDTWGFGPTNWTDLAPALTPALRQGHGMLFDGARVLLHGGGSGVTFYNDLLAFAAGNWTDITPGTDPGDRVSFGFAWDGSRAVRFGGLDLSVAAYDDTWIFDTDWSEIVTASAPSPRIAPAMFALGSRVFLFGGRGPGPSSTLYGDTWLFEDNDWTELSFVGDTPDARYLTSMAVLAGSAYLFGGDGAGGELADTWVFEEVTTAAISHRFGLG